MRIGTLEADGNAKCGNRDADGVVQAHQRIRSRRIAALGRSTDRVCHGLYSRARQNRRAGAIDRNGARRLSARWMEHDWTEAGWANHEAT
jgi:hypothetical protein